MRVEILVEEESMKTFLEGIIPRICNPKRWKLEENVFIRPFEGKSHLRKELPKKAKVYAYFNEPIFMLVLQDQDSSHCQELKQGLNDLILPSGFKNYKVRIVCKELECWYLGDLEAVEKAYPQTKATRFLHKSKFRNPEILNGKEEIKKWVQPYGAIEFAKEIGSYIDIENNKSKSFRHTVSVLKEVLS